MATFDLEELQAVGAPRPQDSELLSKNERKQAFAWVKESKSQDSADVKDDTEKKLSTFYNKLVDEGRLGEQASKVSGVGASLLERSLGYLARKLKKGYENVVEIGRRRRKYGLVATGALAGAGVGALLGTFVLPGLGTAVGGAVGAAISSVVGTLGGVIGTSLITAGAGAYVGNRMGKNLADSESAYKFKPAIQTKIEKKLFLSTEESTKLYAYLRNRQERVQDPDLREAIKLLKNGLFKSGKLEGATQLAFYLCQELTEINRLENPSQALLNDAKLLTAVLNKLQLTNNVDRKSKAKISRTLESVQTLAGSDDGPLVHPVKHETSISKKEASSSLLYSKEASAYPGLIANFSDSKPALKQKYELFNQNLTDQFKAVWNDIDNIQVDSSASPSKNKHTVHYQVNRKDLSRIDFSIQEKAHKNGVKTKFTMSCEVQSKEDAAKALVSSAAIYMKALPAKGATQLRVVAHGDREWAICLMAAALEQNLTPVLDAIEFPDEEKRQEIEQQAQGLLSKKSSTELKFSR